MNEKYVTVRLMDDIKLCADKSGVDKIFEIINDGAQAYKGIIPDDRWHEPYMPFEELRQEIEAGIVFWGLESDGELQGVMGIQDKGDVMLIRHAYVRTRSQNRGIGTKLLRHLEKMAENPSLSALGQQLRGQSHFIKATHIRSSWGKKRTAFSESTGRFRNDRCKHPWF